MHTDFVDEPEVFEDPEAMVSDGEIVTDQASNDYARMWDTLEAACETQATMTAMVVDATRGGLAVDLGVRGFIPKSEIATRNLGNLDRYIGQTVDVKVVEANRESGRLVLSERRTASEKRAAQKVETLKTLERGQVVEGVVRRITEFGAFVDIGGVDGLLHISDLAWENVEKVEDVVSVGQTLQVKVLKIERDGERISLGLKQLGEDPWAVVRNELREGHLLDVEVLRVEPAGVAVRLFPQVEGFIPASELVDRRSGEQAPALEPGQTVNAKILEMRLRERSIILSLRQANRDRERNEARDYMRRQTNETATPTLGDLFGDVFSKLKKDE